MKKNRTLFVTAFMVSISCIADTKATTGIMDNNYNQIKHTVKLENNNNMKSNLLITLGLTGILLFGFQIVKAQELSPNAKKMMDFLTELKKKVDTGTVFKDEREEYEKSQESKALIACVEDNTFTFLAGNGFDDDEKKVLESLLGKIKQSIEKRGGIDPVFGKKKEANPEQSIANNPVLNLVLTEIKETTNIVKEFNPKTQVFTGSYKWIWNAISKKERESWAGKFFTDDNEKFKPEFYAALDELSAAFSKNVSKLNPRDAFFANHNAADEALMRKQIASTVKVEKIGIEYKDWEVQWDESKLVKTPAKRFKRAYILGKDSKEDHGYCQLYQVNLIQDYKGGDKYGATYAKYLDSWPKACPSK